MTASQPFLSDQGGVLFLYLLIFVAYSYERGLEIAFSVSSFPPSDNFNSGTACKESRNLVFQFPFTTSRYDTLCYIATVQRHVNSVPPSSVKHYIRDHTGKHLNEVHEATRSYQKLPKAYVFGGMEYAGLDATLQLDCRRLTSYDFIM